MADTYYQLPLLAPESDWRMPTELPDLRDRPLVMLDTETKDDSLSQRMGPGWPYRKGYIAGISWYTEGSAGYAPIRHPDSECFDKEQVARWLKDHVKAGVRIGFQNAPYDVGWLWADLGVELPPEYPIEDTLAAAFMYDENEYEYNLDAICARLGLPGKDETKLWEAGEAYLRPAGAKKSWKLTKTELKSNMWRMPARFVGRYAEMDAESAYHAMRKLSALLEEQNVVDAYRLEMDLVPTVQRMRARGIKIDVERAYQHQDHFTAKRDELLKRIKDGLPGRGEVEIDHLRSNKWLERVFTEEGIPFPRNEPTRHNPEGSGSFDKGWMRKYDRHWLPSTVSRALQYENFASKFIGNYILDYLHKGRIHAEIHQYKSDDGGTVSYRFAYSHPPLQQAPSADLDPELGMAFRELFVAEGLWGANDYSQQEYRLTAHFAAVCKVRGGAEIERLFNENPDIDFHRAVAEMAGLTRSRAKILNFGILYGQGLETTARQLDISLEEAKELRDQIAEKAPFGPALDDYCKRRAQQRGFLRLLDGARVRFDSWEAAWVSREEYARGVAEKWPMGPCSLEEARARAADPRHPWYGARLRRAHVRKSLNRLIQGSAARQTKLAMRQCAREGLIPILQMHDELDHDEPTEENIHRVSEIMRTVVPLRIPMKVDAGIGKTWAEAKSKG